MDRDMLTFDVAKDLFIRRGFPAEIVIGLKAIYRHGKPKTRKRRPGFRDWSKRAGYDLYVDASLDQLRKQNFELAITNEWVSTYDGQVQGLVFID